MAEQIDASDEWYAKMYELLGDLDKKTDDVLKLEIGSLNFILKPMRDELELPIDIVVHQEEIKI